MLEFKIIKKDGAARLGELRTAHGTVETPTFMPVGTDGTVKAMKPEDVAATGAKIILGNVYHLMLRPGIDRVKELGGLHKMMNWDKAILTDSGGFQVMSLGPLRTISEQGVKFRSHLDNDKIYDLTPEKSVEIQHALDANITMALDECLELPAPKEVIEKSMLLSVRWAERSFAAFKDRKGYGIFGILQGGDDWSLREKCCELMNKIPFDGLAFGGVWLNVLTETIDVIIPCIPEEKPRYVMGVGIPADIVDCTLRGIDMFDCVLPSRFGRTAQGFLKTGGTLNLKKGDMRDDMRPVDEFCTCPTCQRYSRAYLHALFKENEPLASMLLTWHNIQVYEDLMKDIREAISMGTLSDFHAAWFETFRKYHPDEYAKFKSPSRTIMLKK